MTPILDMSTPTGLRAFAAALREDAQKDLAQADSLEQEAAELEALEIAISEAVK